MIPTLHIQNFKLFRDLEIKGLKRVNLFAGKNNSGKTALLEALRIMKAGEDIRALEYILSQRGADSDFNTKYDTLFNRLKFPKKGSGIDDINIRINGYCLNRSIEEGRLNPEYKISSDLNSKKELKSIFSELRSRYNWNPPLRPNDKVVYLPFNSSEHFPIEAFWESIVLTPDEDKVVEILKNTILPSLIRLDVKNDRTLVRLEGESKPLPLKSLGDGAQRMLLMAIALVSAQNNMLLIDEIETGLHYSVLEKLWEIIFKYAEELNVQVFVTTHSSDAIKSFTYTLEKEGNKDQGAYFRLQANRKNGDIEAIDYDLEKLELSLETNLEPR